VFLENVFIPKLLFFWVNFCLRHYGFGVYYYDRRPKFDIERIREINSRPAAYEKDPPVDVDVPYQDDWTVLIGANPDAMLAREWSYTTDKPANDWMSINFDDKAWKKGAGGFGECDGLEDIIRTPWTSSDIWMRQEFDYNGSTFDEAMLIIRCDDTAQVYVNGIEIWKSDAWTNSYTGIDVTKSLLSAIKKGKNTIAIHCHEYNGGQFIDAALLIKNNK
jgi:hypothetical protein